MYFTAAMATLGSLVEQRDWSKTVAIHELAPPLGFIAAPLVTEAGMALGGWQNALLGMGCLSLAGGVAFLVFGRGGRALADPPSLQGLGEAFHNPAFRLFGWLFALGVAAEFAPYNVLPLSLTAERGFGQAEASALLSASRLVSPAAVLCGGWLTPRFGVRRTLRFFLLTEALSLMALASPWLPVTIVAMCIQPLAPAFAFPAIFLVLAETFPPGRQSMLLAVSVPAAAGFGTGIMPQLLGACGDHFSFAAGFFCLGLVYLFSLPLLNALRGKSSAG
jgi:NNP family nitrate/nitrite transporter-like MFS transporter